MLHQNSNNKHGKTIKGGEDKEEEEKERRAGVLRRGRGRRKKDDEADIGHERGTIQS
jgi:hypothetical protein